VGSAAGSVSAAMDVPVELRQLRYFVAVAEELHFGRAAERLHMSQSPLSRAIRELERELGVVLFVRTTRRVELTAAGSVLLKRSRRALAEIDGAIAEARRSSRPDVEVLGVGYGPFSGPVARRIAAEFEADGAGVRMRLDEEVTPESLRRIAAHELAAAVVMESPAAARHHGVRIDTLRDEPLWRRCRHRTSTRTQRRYPWRRLWPRWCCCRVSRLGSCSMPGFGRCFARRGSSSIGRCGC
jgi:DNA-binding transcriptional LysR family regulator